MAHQFDVRAFERVLADGERLLARTREHEDRLASLVDAASGRAAIGKIGDVPVPSTEHSSVPDIADGLLGLVQSLCVNAQEQRQLAQRIVAHLLGDAAPKDRKGPVLVVDDVDDSRNLTVDVLESYGFHVITAANGFEALLVAHYARPVLVVMDISMPVLNGLDAARVMKASAVTRHLNLIAYTGNPDACEGPSGKFFADVIRKPAGPDAIVAVAERHIPPPR